MVVESESFSYPHATVIYAQMYTEKSFTYLSLHSSSRAISSELYTLHIMDYILNNLIHRSAHPNYRSIQSKHLNIYLNCDLKLPVTWISGGRFYKYR